MDGITEAPRTPSSGVGSDVTALARELLAKAAQAVEGPWQSVPDGGGECDVRNMGDGTATPFAYICTASPEDADFIAAANPLAIATLCTTFLSLTTELTTARSEREGRNDTERLFVVEAHGGDQICDDPAAARDAGYVVREYTLVEIDPRLVHDADCTATFFEAGTAKPTCPACMYAASRSEGANE